MAGLLLVDVLLGALDEGQDVAHAEDPAGEPVGMEDLEGVGLLAGAQELDRDAGDRRDRQGGTAAGIAIDLGQDQAGDRDRGDERLGDGDGLLAGHGVDHEERLDRLDGVVDGGDLGHQRLVDREAAGGVEDDDVADLALGRLDAAAGDVDDRGPDGRPVDGDVEAACPSVSSWSAAAGRYGSAATSSGRRPSLTTCRASLARRGRLARALEADHRDDRRVARQVEGPVAGRQERDQLVVDDLDHLLAGRQAVEHLVADRPLADARDEVLDDLEVDVGLEQREPDLAHGGIDVGLADPAAAGQVAERLAQPLAEGVEHGPGRDSRGVTGRTGARPGRAVREF